MSKYIGSSAVNLSTTSADVTGNADIDGNLTVGGNLTVSGTTITVDHATAQTVDLGDGDKIRLGADYELQLWSDGTTGQISGDFNHTGSITTDGLTVDGNLLVGNTTTGLSSAGVNLHNNGTFELRRDLGSTNVSTVGYISRGSTDGNILQFYKDTTHVGTIGTQGGEFTIGQGDTGLKFHEGVDAILPWNTSASNTNRDATIDLGNSTNRFAESYFSSALSINPSSNGYAQINLGDPSQTQGGPHGIKFYTQNGASGDHAAIQFRTGDNTFNFENTAAQQSIKLYPFTGQAVFNNTNNNTGDFQVKSANQNHMLFVDASANSIGIRKSSPDSSYVIDSSGSTRFEDGTMTLRSTGEAGPHTYRSGNSGNDIRFFSTNGTFSSPTAKTNGSAVGQIHWSGYDGTQYRQCASVTVSVDGSVSSGNMPMRMGFHTGTTSAVERMRIDRNGAVTMPYQPSFEAYLGSQWTLTNGATVPFGSTSYNTGSGYNTSNYRFTAPVAGKYLFYIHTYTSVANGDIRALHFQFGKNGNSNFRDLTHGGYTNDGGYSYHPAIVGTVIMNLAANDYVYIYFNGGGYSGGNVSLAATSTYWGGYLLG